MRMPTGLELVRSSTTSVHWMIRTTRWRELILTCCMSQSLHFDRTPCFTVYYRIDSTSGVYPSKGMIFFQNVAGWLPNGFLTWLSERSQAPSQVRLRQNRVEAHHVARALIDIKKEELRAGTSRRDLMSLLSPSPSTRNGGGTNCGV